MRATTMLILGCLLLPAGAARADACKSDATQRDLDECAARDFEQADSALNGTYRKIMDRLHDDAEARTLLVAAQKAWLGFRDAECAFDASGTRGGTIHPMLVAGCRAQLTRDRTKVLQGDLTCQEGDTSCPVPPQ